MAELEYRDGFLVEGPVRARIDEVVICDPWRVTIAEFRAASGVGGNRGRLFEALDGFCDWFFPDGHDDSSRRLWVRGQFGCTNLESVDDLELVVHYDGTRLSRGDTWVLRALSGKPDLSPGRLVIAALNVRLGVYGELVDKEARRSRVSARDPSTGEHPPAGWVEIDEREGAR